MVYFGCNLLRLYSPFTCDTILSFASPQFRGKRPRSCQDPETLDPGFEAFLLILMGFKLFHQRKTRHIKHYSIDNETQYSKAPLYIKLYHNRCLKIKRPKAWNIAASLFGFGLIPTHWVVIRGAKISSKAKPEPRPAPREIC